MNSVKNSVKIFSFATLLSIVLSSCSGTPPIVPSDSPQIIPYSESRMAEFSKELSETSEIYIESNNGLRKQLLIFKAAILTTKQQKTERLIKHIF